MSPIITKDTAVSLGLVALVAAGVWWAATVQSDLNYVKRDVSDVKASVARIDDALSDRKTVSLEAVTERAD